MATIEVIPILEFLKRDVYEVHGLEGVDPDKCLEGYKQVYSRSTFKRRYTNILDRIEENKKWIEYYKVRNYPTCIVLHTERINELEKDLINLEKEITEKYV